MLIDLKGSLYLRTFAIVLMFAYSSSIARAATLDALLSAQQPAADKLVAQADQANSLFLHGLGHYHEFARLGDTTSYELLDKAAFYFRAASNLGSSRAAYAMGELHFSNLGSFTVNQSSALDWLQVAIDGNDGDAMLSLGSRLVMGEGVHKDIVLGASLIGRAEALNHERAFVYRHWAESELFLKRLDDVQWISGQPLSRFTIEISSVYDEENVRSILLNQSHDNTASYRTKSNEWRIIVGSYSNRLEAERVKRDLFGEFSSGPMIRSFADVRLELLPSNPTLDAQWLITQNPNLFTALLFETDRESQAHDFIVYNGLQNAGLIRKNNYKFQVIAGIFDTRTEAQEALNGLPDNLKNSWAKVVTVLTVQQNIGGDNDLPLPFVADQLTPQIESVTELHEAETDQLSAATSNSLAANGGQPNVDGEGSRPSNLSGYPLPKFQPVAGYDWFADIAASAYTIELFSAKSYHQAVDMISFIGLQQGVVVEHQSGHFLLCSGVFADYANAQQALQQLPSELQTLQPKIQPIGPLLLQLIDPQTANKGDALYPEERAQVTLQSGSLNLRATDGINSKVIALLANGAWLKVIDRQKDRAKVKAQDGSVGWVASKYLSKVEVQAQTKPKSEPKPRTKKSSGWTIGATPPVKPSN